MDLLRFRTAVAVVSIFLIASCGGGGGSDTPAPQPPTTPPSTPTNTAPVVTLTDSTLSMDENSTITTVFTVSDAQNDSISVSTTSSNLDVSESNGTITIISPEVDGDIAYSITVTATDNNQASSTATITVNVKNIVATSTPPVLTWVQDSTPDYQMQERTFFVLPFNVNDADTDLSELTFTLDLEKQGNDQNSVEFTFDVDIQNQTLRINAGRSLQEALINYTGAFEVSDGQNSVSVPLSISVSSNKRDTQLDFLRDIFIVQGASKIVIFDYVADSPEDFEITAIRYKDNSDQIADLLDFSYDLTNQTLSFTAQASSFINNGDNEIVMLIDFNDKGQFNYTNEFRVTIRESVTDNEIALEAQLFDFKQIIVLSREYEAIGNYINNYLLIKGFVSSDEFFEQQTKLKTFRDLPEADANFTTNDIQYRLLNTTTYTDDAKYQEALDKIAVNKTSLSNQKLVNISDYINQLMTLDLDDTFSQNIDAKTIIDLEADFVSRFVGDAQYGAFDSNGIWQFNEAYSFMQAPISKLQSRMLITQ